MGDYNLQILSIFNHSNLLAQKSEGVGFDFYNLPDPTAPENIEKPTGRGIFLMKHLSDQLIFSDNGRTIEMHFRKTMEVVS